MSEVSAATPTPLLRLNRISKRFPGVLANDSVDFEVLSRNGVPPAFREIEDTVNLAVHEVLCAPALRPWADNTECQRSSPSFQASSQRCDSNTA